LLNAQMCIKFLQNITRLAKPRHLAPKPAIIIQS